MVDVGSTNCTDFDETPFEKQAHTLRLSYD